MVRPLVGHNILVPAGRPALIATGSGGVVTFGPLVPPTPAAPTVSNATISPSSGTIGDTFTASATVTGYPTPTRTYVWELDGTPIVGATASTYQAENAGSLTVVVSATNSEGGPVSDESDPVTVSEAPSSGIGAMAIGSTFEVA